jgi:hypothetical protein
LYFSPDEQWVVDSSKIKTPYTKKNSNTEDTRCKLYVSIGKSHDSCAGKHAENKQCVVCGRSGPPAPPLFERILGETYIFEVRDYGRILLRSKYKIHHNVKIRLCSEHQQTLQRIEDHSKQFEKATSKGLDLLAKVHTDAVTHKNIPVLVPHDTTTQPVAVTMVLPPEYMPLLGALDTLNPRTIARVLADNHPDIVRAATTRLVEEDMTLLKAQAPENPLYPDKNADEARKKMTIYRF